MTSTAQLQGFAHPSTRVNGSMAQLENWAFAAPPRSPLVNAWLEAFRRALILGADRYMGLNSTKRRMLMAESEYEGNYLLQHAAYDEARAQLPDAPVIIHSAIEPHRPYWIQQACNWEVSEAHPHNRRGDPRLHSCMPACFRDAFATTLCAPLCVHMVSYTTPHVPLVQLSCVSCSPRVRLSRPRSLAASRTRSSLAHMTSSRRRPLSSCVATTAPASRTSVRPALPWPSSPDPDGHTCRPTDLGVPSSPLTL